MAQNHFLEAILIFSTFLPLIVLAADDVPVPADKSQVEKWFKDNVLPLSPEREALMDHKYVLAEQSPKTITLNADGSGDFKTLTEALKSIQGSKVRTFIKIGGGNYTEKVTITQNYVTLYGDPKNMPIFVFDGTAAKYGTDDSATITVDSDYFVAKNIIFVNNAPRAKPGQEGGQATALRIRGTKAALYNCKGYGFQDTLCDDEGMHLFKDCYFEGTVDFIFGNARSIYLNVEAHVIRGDPVAFVTAQAKDNDKDDTGFSFIHSSVTGSGGTAYLGRAWMSHAKTIFSYCTISDAIHPDGWSSNKLPQNEKTVFFAEYTCTGPGANLDKRVKFAKKLGDEEVKPYLTLGYIEASKWLLPPPQL